jgi:hypothetical protein
MAGDDRRGACRAYRQILINAMRLFSAGVYTTTFHRGSNLYERLTAFEKQQRDSTEHFLESYHYINKQITVDRLRNDGVKVFLDSGAFSAFMIGAKIDLDKYCEYIHRNGDIIEFASVLDAIGDPDGTWRNQDYMERQGTQPLPCFHYGEPDEVLQYYISKYEYITIGGMVPISTPQLMLWLDRIWDEYLTHKEGQLAGKPKVRVHGFGLTSLPLMLRYPWYSVDSTTWQKWGSNGMILLPGAALGKAWKIDISEQSSRAHQIGMHIDTVAPLETNALQGKIVELGGDPDRLRESYLPRWSWNLWAFPYYVEQKRYEEDKFETVEQRLF